MHGNAKCFAGDCSAHNAPMNQGEIKAGRDAIGKGGLALAANPSNGRAFLFAPFACAVAWIMPAHKTFCDGVRILVCKSA